MKEQEKLNNEEILINNKLALFIISIILLLIVATSCVAIRQTVKYINSSSKVAQLNNHRAYKSIN